MTRHIIRLERTDGCISSNSIETDAENGMGNIPNVLNVEIESASENEITLSYEYSSEAPFNMVNEVLAQFSLQLAK